MVWSVFSRAAVTRHHLGWTALSDYQHENLFHARRLNPIYKVVCLIPTRAMRPTKRSVVMANSRSGWQLDFTSVFRRSDSRYYLFVCSLYTYAAVTCHEPEPKFDFAMLIEALLLKGAQCKPVEEAFAILGTPLISCEGDVCSFHCLSGLHHGAKEGVGIFWVTNQSNNNVAGKFSVLITCQILWVINYDLSWTHTKVTLQV